MHEVADNLDDVHEYLQLLRQACNALNAFHDAIPPLRLVTHNHKYPGYIYRGSERAEPRPVLQDTAAKSRIEKAKASKQRWAAYRVSERLKETNDLIAEQYASLKGSWANGGNYIDAGIEDFERYWGKCTLCFIIQRQERPRESEAQKKRNRPYDEPLRVRKARKRLSKVLSRERRRYTFQRFLLDFPGGSDEDYEDFLDFAQDLLIRAYGFGAEYPYYCS